METLYSKDKDLPDTDFDEIINFIKKTLPESKEIFNGMTEDLASVIKSKDLVLFADF